MKRITNIDEIKKYELDILTFIKKICENNNLRYYLAAGTLLGAIRHGGFIPWDDDIDIYMPRPDYERFLELMSRQYLDSRYQVLSHENAGYYYNFAKVVDVRTKLYEKNVNPIDGMGIYVDIFPLEGFPSDKESQKNQFKLLNKCREKIFDFEYGFPKLRKNLFMYIYRVYTYIACKCRNLSDYQKHYVDLAKRYDYDESQDVFVTGGRYKMKEVFPKEYIGSGENVFFEGIMFTAPQKYDLLLKRLYGDYMTLPPEKDRVNRHGFEVYFMGYDAEE